MQTRIKVAVIDSKITSNFLVDDINIKKYVSLKQKSYENLNFGTIQIIENQSVEVGEKPEHGTLVLNTIKKYAVDIPLDFYVYDVFDDYGNSSGAVLVETIKMILESEIDIIVMSLTCSSQYSEDFKKLASIIKKKQILLICAAANNGQDDCPANLDFVYGVSGDKMDKSGLYKYSVDSSIQFWSDVQWEFVGRLDKLNVFCGTSKATAVIAGRLISYIYEHGKNKMLSYLLFNHDEFHEVEQEITEEQDLDEEILLKYCEAYGISKEFCMKNLDVSIPWHQGNIDNFVVFLRSLGVENEVYKLNYSEFSSLRNIVQSCKVRMKNV